MLTHAGRLGELTVLDETGQAQKVSTMWADSIAVIAWVRHFG